MYFIGRAQDFLSQPTNQKFIVRKRQKLRHSRPLSQSHRPPLRHRSFSILRLPPRPQFLSSLGNLGSLSNRRRPFMEVQHRPLHSQYRHKCRTHSLNQMCRVLTLGRSKLPGSPEATRAAVSGSGTYGLSSGYTDPRRQAIDGRRLRTMSQREKALSNFGEDVGSYKRWPERLVDHLAHTKNA